MLGALALSVSIRAYAADAVGNQVRSPGPNPAALAPAIAPAGATAPAVPQQPEAVQAPAAVAQPKIKSILNSSAGSTFAPQSITGEKTVQAKAVVTGKVTDLTGVKGLDHSRILMIKEDDEHKRVEVETRCYGVFSSKIWSRATGR